MLTRCSSCTRISSLSSSLIGVDICERLSSPSLPPSRCRRWLHMYRPDRRILRSRRPPRSHRRPLSRTSGRRANRRPAPLNQCDDHMPERTCIEPRSGSLWLGWPCARTRGIVPWSRYIGAHRRTHYQVVVPQQKL